MTFGTLLKWTLRVLLWPLLLLLLLLGLWFSPGQWQANLTGQALVRLGIEHQGLSRERPGHWRLQSLQWQGWQLEGLHLQSRPRWHQGRLEISELDLSIAKVQPPEALATERQSTDWQQQLSQVLEQLPEQLNQAAKALPDLPILPVALTANLRIDQLSWQAEQTPWQLDLHLNLPHQQPLQASLNLQQFEAQSLSAELHWQPQTLTVTGQWQPAQDPEWIQPLQAAQAEPWQLGFQLELWEDADQLQWQAQAQSLVWPYAAPDVQLQSSGQLAKSSYQHHAQVQIREKDALPWLDLNADFTLDQQSIQLDLDDLPLYWLAPWIDELDGLLSGQFNVQQQSQSLQVHAQLQGQGWWQQWPWQLDLGLKPEQRLQVMPSFLQLGEQSLNVQGWVDLSHEQLQLDISNVQLNQFSLWQIDQQDWPAALQSWQAQGQAQLSGSWYAPDWQAELSAILDPRGPWPVQASATAQGNFEQAQFERLHLLAPQGLELDFQGLIDWQRATLGGQLGFELMNDDSLRPWLASYLDLSELQASQLKGRLQSQVQGPWNQLAGKGQLSLRALLHGQSASLNLDSLSWRYPELAFDLKAGKLQIGDNGVQAQGQYQWQQQVEASLALDLNNLKQGMGLAQSYGFLADLVWPEQLEKVSISGPVQLSGASQNPDLSAELRADALVEQQPLGLSTELTFSEQLLTVPRFSVNLGDGSLTGLGRYHLGSSEHQLQLDLSDFDPSLGYLWLEDPDLADFLQQLNLQLQGQWQSHGPIAQASYVVNLSSQANIEQQQAGFLIQAEGQWPQIKLDEIHLSAGDLGWLDASFDWQSADDITFDWQAQLNLEPWLELARDLELVSWQGRSPVSGQLRSQLRITGALEQPNIQGQQILDIRIDDPSLPEPLPLNLTWSTRTQEELWINELHLELFERGAWRLASRSPKQLSEWLAESQFSLKGQSDLAAISRLFNWDEQSLAGQVEADLNWQGGIEEPLVNGWLRLNRGRYQNLRSGSLIRNIELELSAHGQGFDISRGRAQDSQQGQVFLLGQARWQRLEDFSLNLNLAAREFHLIQRFDLDAYVQGDLDFTFAQGRGLLTGDLNMSPLQIRLDRMATSSISRLNVVAPDVEEPDQLDILDYIDLDITLTANRRAFLYGQGLDAELEGQIRVSGLASDPRIQGEFNVIQGRYDLLTRVFRIEKGFVRLEQQAIFLNLRAKHAGPEYDFFVDLNGEDDNFDLQLSSEPSLPEDQLIAQLLFGKGIEGMTAFQAIRLANAVNRLRDPGAHLDPLKAAGDLLGLDNVELSDQDDELSINAGKYLTDKVYIQFGTGFGEQGLNGKVRWELTPQLRLEGYSGSRQEEFNSGAEFIWQRDF